MSTVGDTMSTPGSVQYTGGGIVSTYQDECGSTLGDTMSTPGVSRDECKGYYEYTGGVQYTRGIS